jgi:hypothetical protein
MASIRLAYIGAGSTRGPGTLGSIIRHGAAFAGSEIVLWDTAQGSQLQPARERHSKTAMPCSPASALANSSLGCTTSAFRFGTA